MRGAAIIAFSLGCGAAMADHTRLGQECPEVRYGSPYVMTEADWLSVPAELIHVREDTDLRDGVIDMTQPGEPMVYPGETRHEFRTKIAGEVLAYSFDANADGKDEIYIEFVKVTTCSNGVVQCLFVLLDDSLPRKVLLETQGHCLKPAGHAHNGWQDLAMIRLRSDYVVEAETFEFDGARYSNSHTTILGSLLMEN